VRVIRSIAHSLTHFLFMSDHATIIKYDEGDLAQHPVPPETPYHRWNITIKFAGLRKDVNVDGVHLNVRVFLAVLSLLNSSPYHPQNAQRASQCRCDGCNRMLYCPCISQRYCRKCKQWFTNECLDALELHTDQVPDSKLPATYDGIQLEEDFIAILTMPICRGGPYGVVGNGWIYYRARSLLKDVRVNGKLPNGWKASLTETNYKVSEVSEGISYYTCPCCADALC
jgi:hypothetical protein